MVIAMQSLNKRQCQHMRATVLGTQGGNAARTFCIVQHTPRATRHPNAITRSQTHAQQTPTQPRT
eukprot:COSAG06_NODE_50855_length_315_cov_47.981481_1_plen_64_part_10